VEHRHLLPDEIDQLLDGEEGFGVAPLRAHVDGCAQCRAELQAQQRIMSSLEQLPHFAPSPVFARRVMSQVQVFEPWHVALLDAVRRYLPEARATRAFAGATAVFVAVILTASAVWAVSRIDALVFFANVGLERSRQAALGFLGQILSAALGDASAAALQESGVTGITIVVSAFVAMVVVAAFGLRLIAASAARRRRI
jgi:hypothetical protein